MGLSQYYFIAHVTLVEIVVLLSSTNKSGFSNPTARAVSLQKVFPRSQMMVVPRCPHTPGAN